MRSQYQLKQRFESFNGEQRDQIIRLAWKDGDGVAYEEIYKRFGLTPGHLVAYMNYVLPKICFKQWRRRIYTSQKQLSKP
jgi:uncharacterized protein (TIGR03643 family)